MADIFTKAKRSEVMSLIRGKGNRSTEGALAAFFRREGITGWRREQPLFGKPDFVFRAERVAVFVDGCFWHGCPKHGRKPKTRKAFWTAKIERNAARDRLVTRTLRASGWRVMRVWEHDLRPKREAILRGRFRRMGLPGKPGLSPPGAKKPPERIPTAR